MPVDWGTCEAILNKAGRIWLSWQQGQGFCFITAQVAVSVIMMKSPHNELSAFAVMNDV